MIIETHKMKEHKLIGNEIEISSITKNYINCFVKKDCRFILIDNTGKYSIVICGYKKDSIIKVYYDEVIFTDTSIEHIFECTYNVKLEKDVYVDFEDDVFDSFIKYEDNKLSGEIFEIIYS